jgi:hypothetical protein
MTRKIKFTKQYKPIGFGETRAYNRRMKELAAEDAVRREGLLSKVFGFFFSRSRRY